MAALRSDHSDTLEFVGAKERPGRLQNFNHLVGITDDLMKKAHSGEGFDLVNPRSGEVTKTIWARRLLKEIAANAGRRGDLASRPLPEQDKRGPPTRPLPA